ncbi:MAG: TolC family protein [Gemmatimonadetes bacterium]|nr:TolC family protein [Gemmatimonadota bacterium]
MAITAACALIPLPGKAQPRRLTLDALQALVATRSPRVLAADARARAADARVPGTARPPDPQVQLGFMNYTLPALRPDPGLGMAQLQVMQMVPLPGKLSAASMAARARVVAAESRVGVAVWEARTAAAMAYYDRWYAWEAARVAVEGRRLLQEAATAASAMYAVGEGQQSDVLRAQVEVARMEEDIIRMTAMEEVAVSRLASIADTSADAVAGAPVLPLFPDSVPSLDHLLLKALDARPMLAAGAADVRVTVADGDVARRERWPDLQVGMQYGQRRAEMGIDRMGSLMFGASLPIFARSRQLPMRAEAAAMRRMAEAEVAGMRAETRAQVTEARLAIASTRRLKALYQGTVLPQALATADATLNAYRNRGVDVMTVLESRMMLNRYRQELLALEADEGRAWAELEMLLGQSLLPTHSSPPESFHD